MSSHREAPLISKDPVADSTDVYAFVSPDDPSTVTLIANYLPLQAPGGGPNFYEFGDDVLYAINIDTTGDGVADISYQWRFTTVNNFPGYFLYNIGKITNLDSPNATWNRQQTYSLSKVVTSGGTTTTTSLGENLPVPPCNVGPLSTPFYAELASKAIVSLPNGGKAFAGQRAEGFYVDLGAVFDLGDLRPFRTDHAGAKAANFLHNMPGVNSTAAVNVHSLALQLPFSEVGATAAQPTIGVWTTASRQRVRVVDGDSKTGGYTSSGPFVQVSRLGNPLANELIIGIGDKDHWNAVMPPADGNSRLLPYFQDPALPRLLPSLYPGVFPNLAAYYSNFDANKGAQPARPDLEAIFLTGLPAGVVKGFSNTIGTSYIPAEMLRLNTSYAPASKPNSLGLLGNDVAGFPNGRRVFDDVATIELRAVAGATLGLVTSYSPDGAAGVVDFGLESDSAPGNANGESGSDLTANGTEKYLPAFPYLGTPYAGFRTPEETPTSKGL